MHKSILLAVLLVGACGGDDGSGIDSGKQLTTLSADEQMSECEYIVSAEGGPGHETMCGNDLTLRTHTVEECVQDLMDLATAGTCTVTVGQSEACARAIADNPCELGGEACSALIACSTGQ